MYSVGHSPERRPVMAKLDIESYRRMVLKPVEDCFMQSREPSTDFSSFGFYQALRSEMTRADAETGLIEVSDDLSREIDNAALRILEHMEHNKDLGFGAAH